MTNYRIEIGATDGFRHIGVEPPVSQEQGDEIRASIDEYYRGTNPATGFRTELPKQGPAHSVLGISTEGYFTSAGADNDMVYVARKIAGILSRQGAMVQVDEEIKNIGFGHHLFGGESDEALLSDRTHHT